MMAFSGCRSKILLFSTDLSMFVQFLMIDGYDLGLLMVSGLTKTHLELLTTLVLTKILIMVLK